MKSLEDLKGWKVFVYGKLNDEKNILLILSFISDVCRVNHNTKLEVFIISIWSISNFSMTFLFLFKILCIIFAKFEVI